jgi:hypothetical protein
MIWPLRNTGLFLYIRLFVNTSYVLEWGASSSSSDIDSKYMALARRLLRERALTEKLSMSKAMNDLKQAALVGLFP